MCFVVVTYKLESPKLILRAGTNVVCDSISGGGSKEVAHSTPTGQKKVLLPSSSTHLLASGI
jgi:hypothetical protein